jgi:hypothetical protein
MCQASIKKFNKLASPTANLAMVKSYRSHGHRDLPQASGSARGMESQEIGGNCKRMLDQPMG